MMIGVKERKDKGDKFSDKIRRNFERFKDKVEGLGKKTLVGGMLLGAAVGVGRGQIVYNTSIDSALIAIFKDTQNRIYYECLTLEDSLEATKREWRRITGTSDPLVWDYELKKVLDWKNPNYDPFNILIVTWIASEPYYTRIINEVKKTSSAQ
ncbi:MAG: hypothetical protein QXL47_02410 [Candidatus Anstonellales archaeon]